MNSIQIANFRKNHLNNLSFPETIKSWRVLTKVFLQYAASCPSFFSTPTHTQFFFICRSNELESLPDVFVNLRTLTEIDLSFNQIYVLNEDIGSLSNLVKLQVNNNKLTTLPKSIGNLKKLQSLEVRSNAISVLPTELGDLVSLVKLDISHNKIGELPSEIGKLEKLTNFDWKENVISVPPHAVLAQGVGATLAYLKARLESGPGSPATKKVCLQM